MAKNISTENKDNKATNNGKNKAKSIINITNRNLKDKIYTIRGQQVMLDFDLAEIYGYTTSAFNQQVRRNLEKFDDDFMFQLSRKEIEDLYNCAPRASISQNVISIQTTGVKGGRSKPPLAFTEQGIYMLMTVLKGELAVKQSKTLIRLFKQMKDYLAASHETLTYKENLKLMTEIAKNSNDMSNAKTDIIEMKNEIGKLDDEMKTMTRKIDNAVMKSEISPIILDFAKVAETREFIFFNGEPARAKETLMDIYNKAKKNIILIDNYINIRTLRLFQNVKENLAITIFSDNYNNLLHKSDYQDFQTERPDLKIDFIKTNNLIHDRFIVLDNKIVYSCGASSKDAGHKITTIHEITDKLIINSILQILETLHRNPKLILK